MSSADSECHQQIVSVINITYNIGLRVDKLVNALEVLMDAIATLYRFVCVFLSFCNIQHMYIIIIYSLVLSGLPGNFQL